MRKPIYLDYNATTPVDPAVVEAIAPYLREHFGNPSSDHAYGYRTRLAMQTAREQLAALLGAAPDEVVFTGSGSEANNLAIKGVAYALRDRGNHIITSAVEHPAVAAPLRFLERQGYQVTTLPVDTSGQVDPAQLAAALTRETILVTIMHANNEVGTIQPIRAIAEIAHARGVLVHTDAAQTVGKIPIDLQALGAPAPRIFPMQSVWARRPRWRKNGCPYTRSRSVLSGMNCTAPSWSGSRQLS